MNDEEVVDGLYQNLEDVENFEICEIFKPWNLEIFETWNV